ncbi:hypothetical protein QVD17_03886 [Tagetes erecta]|uniref:Uncharacterized protein n=1 Tax=Tagetes erecta TaxID=13708 RepID=A0AAD8LEE8_TARER|nr:hypothetical protein QVD17_03886 [Tagetes erecta]
MNSDGYSYERCFEIVYILETLISSSKELSKHLSNDDISHLRLSCVTEGSNSVFPVLWRAKSGTRADLDHKDNVRFGT